MTWTLKCNIYKLCTPIVLEIEHGDTDGCPLIYSPCIDGCPLLCDISDVEIEALLA